MVLSTDRDRGKVLLISACALFLYYTIWVIGLPFIDDNRLKSLFYSHNIALKVPAVSGLCFVGSLMIFTAYHIRPYLGIKANTKKD